jgi:WD40 repeat protein
MCILRVSLCGYNIFTMKSMRILGGLALLVVGLALAGCGTQILYPTSTPWPTRTPRPTQTSVPTLTLTPSITPTPTEIVPAQAGTPLPPEAAVIASANAPALALFGEWGRGIPQGAALSPDGSLAAVVSTRGLFVYDGATLALLRQIGPGTGLRAAAFAPDGSLAVGAEDGRIRVYRPESGELLHDFQAHRGPVLTLAFATDGERLASGGWDGAVRLWRWGEERLLMAFEGHSGPPRGVSFSPDGETLYSWSPDDHLRIWPLSGRTPPEPIYLGIDARRKSGSSAGFSSSGEFFAIDQDVRVRLLFTRTGNTRITLTGFDQPVERVAVAPDGVHVATVAGGNIRVWNGQNGSLAAELILPPGAWAGTLVFSTDGARLLAVGDAVHLWSLDAPGETLASSAAAYQPGYRLFSHAGPDGAALWNVLPGGQAQPYRLSDGALLPLTGTVREALNALAYSSDGSLAAAAGADRRIMVWHTNDGAAVASLAGAQGMPLSLAFAPDGARLAAASGEAVVRVWEMGSGALAAELDTLGPVTKVSFSPDGAWLAGISRQQTHLWRTEDWQLAETLPGRGLVFSGDGRLTARFVDGLGGTQVALAGPDGAQLTLAANGGALAFSAAGDLLAVSGIELTVWDASSGEQVFGVESPAAYGNVLFSPDGRRLLLTAPDGVLYVYAVP